MIMLSALGLWQIGVFTHLAIVPHDICPHGHIVDNCHSHAHGDAPFHEGDKPSHSHRHSSPHRHHGNCPALDSVTAAASVTAQAVAPPPALFEAAEQAAYIETGVTLAAAHLYLLSPCHSPPVLS